MAINPEELSATELLNNVISAAQRVEYCKHFGRHGDGKDKTARLELAKARTRALAAMRKSS